MSESSSHSDGDEQRTETALTYTRRTAMALLGVGSVSALAGNAAAAEETTEGETGGGKEGKPWNRDVNANGHSLSNLGELGVRHVYTSAREADVVVWKDGDGVFHADGPDGEIANGEAVVSVTRAAIEGLTDGRTSVEKVVVASPGEIREGDGSIELPSYTALDVPVTLSVPDGEEVPPVVRAEGAERIEVESLTVEGPAAMGVRLTSCSEVRLGDLRIAGVRSDGVRIDGRGDAPRSTDIQVERVYVEKNDHHAFETYGVDRLQVDQIIGVDPASCVVLLNDTADATVNSIVGKEPGVPDGYATFRVANGAHDITVGEVVSRGGARGVFGVSECYDVTVGEVNIEGASDQGILVQNCQDFAVQGGVVKNCDGDGVRIDSRDDGEQIPAEGVSITNLRIYDDRDDPKQPWGILETGPATNTNRIVGNDVRGAGTETDIRTFSNTTVVRDNVGGGFASGTVTLSSGDSPAARVEGVSSSDYASVPGSVEEPQDFELSALDLRAKPAAGGSSATYSWESYFEWDGDDGAWDLVFEWRTDPGTDLELDYVVDKTR
ncbi:Right handed beta helix region [Halopelagius inordinatus]|uniref:Right handed beta helix region n=1 Tax=Halopelagius inordinatus TaxID=553467 RepID=A0A1I2VSJ2_9EURY|nr:right-handed parallel beta-helix repeat-containing protein [Halopelagius inordinatus]SFG92188.1 Right handed beta helix region [Halopelagius inordinatus]